MTWVDEYEHLRSAQGLVDRPLEISGWHPAEAATVRDSLVGWTDSTRLTRSGPGLLAEFVDLADAPDDEFVAYASRWGALTICRHGLPGGPYWVGRWIAWHKPGCHRRNVPRMKGFGSCVSLAAWRHWARQARALLRIANELHATKPGAPADWRIVNEWGTPEALLSGPSQRWRIKVDPKTGGVSGQPSLISVPGSSQRGPSIVYAQQRAVEDWVNVWLELGAIAPRLQWGRSPARAIFSGNYLLGALAMHLLLAIGRGQPAAFCAGCERMFVPRGSGAGGTRRYCERPECKKMSVLHAQRDRRQRLRLGIPSPRKIVR